MSLFISHAPNISAMKHLLLASTVLWFLGIASSCIELTPKKTERVFEEIPDDPLRARIYTLKNGLKVYLTKNPNEPRIQTYIAVKAGSKMDPAQTTGLAHYLEHMLFKGTRHIGTKNWEKEKPLLDSISALYEAHLMESDPLKKKKIYTRIDSFSYEAAKYAIPNEYDKMISSLGAKGTNAFTWVEQTVYVNDIPSNELEKWLIVESERFREVVLRLFHTELETVYEEFNRSQDSDHSRAYQAFYKALFPTHPYGTQPTIGLGEHLKNPSMVNIYRYFNTYYVPNNMAICLSGDLDFDKTIALVEKYFGDYPSREIPELKFEPQPEFTEPQIIEVFGPQPEHLFLGFRMEGANTYDALILKLINGILSNGQAGLIDLNIMQKQKALNAEAYLDINVDYSVHGFYGEPREGQTLEELKSILLAQLDSIKQGKFDDWLLTAVIKNMKLEQTREYEQNSHRAYAFVHSFITNVPWSKVVRQINEMEKITKEDIIRFANQKYKDNYVVVYKRHGEAKDVMKVEKPPITPVALNRDDQSAFAARFDSISSERITPLFVDYQKQIHTSEVNGVPFSYVKNQLNDLFELHYLLDMGSDHDKQLELAIKYLPYLGTDRYTAEELKKEFFKLGLSFDINTSRDKVYITLKGLQESFEEGVKLFEHILSSVNPDKQAYADLVEGILKQRADAKKEKWTILFSAMYDYGKYGSLSPFTHILSAKELKTIDPATLVEKIKSLMQYKHRIFYYGSAEEEIIKKQLATSHTISLPLKEYPDPVKFVELDMTDNKVYFINYDMVQTEMLMLSKVQLFNKNIIPASSLFNEYFGSGLSSIVFQEIREAKALAYSAYATYALARKKDESDYVYAYIGTQADKLKDATIAMNELMNNMPEAETQFHAAKDAALKKIESERITGTQIFWSYERAKNRGLDYDIRKDIYEKIPGMTMADLRNFFDQYIKGKKYTYLVLGKRQSIDFGTLRSLGKVEELTLEKVFGY